MKKGSVQDEGGEGKLRTGSVNVGVSEGGRKRGDLKDGAWHTEKRNRSGGVSTAQHQEHGFRDQMETGEANG